MDFKAIIEEMKGKGIEVAVVSRAGGLLYSTFAMDEPAPNVSLYLANNAQLLMEQIGDDAKEIEISLEDKLLVIFPAAAHVILGLVKDMEGKKILRDYADTLKTALSSEEQKS